MPLISKCSYTGIPMSFPKIFFLPSRKAHFRSFTRYKNIIVILIITGDARANENIHLTTVHLIMVRQHNMIAGHLLSMNPHWDDERIFQETRHIVTAQIQHITFNEFLPVLLGRWLLRHSIKTIQNHGKLYCRHRNDIMLMLFCIFLSITELLMEQSEDSFLFYCLPTWT